MIWSLSAATALGCPSIALAQKPTEPAPPSAPSNVDPIVEQLVEGHNKERAKAGLPPLKLDAKLEEAAKAHAKDMAEHEKMTHDGSDGSTSRQRIVGTGYHALGTGENVAVGYKGVADVILSWMESPPHKKNILGDFSEIGVAMVVGKDGKPYWCTDFGTPFPKFDPATASTDLVKRINDERAAAKLPELTVDNRLAKGAQDQATSLAKKKSQGGETTGFDGIDQKFYKELAMSTANGHPNADAMVKALMANPQAKSQVLGKFTKIGTGFAADEDGIPYWCLVLAIPARR
jgi:uncharacterized protein YkwD